MQTTQMDIQPKATINKKQKIWVISILAVLLILTGIYIYQKNKTPHSLTTEEKEAILKQNYPDGFGEPLSTEEKQEILNQQGITANEDGTTDTSNSLSAEQKNEILRQNGLAQ